MRKLHNKENSTNSQNIKRPPQTQQYNQDEETEEYTAGKGTGELPTKPNKSGRSREFVEFSLLWSFLTLGGVLSVACQGFLVREACVGVLVGGAGFLLSKILFYIYIFFAFFLNHLSINC